MQSLPTQNIQTASCKVRTIRRQAEWCALLSEYAASNLSQKAFCESHQLSMSRFYQWKKKLSTGSSDQNNFVDISAQVQETPFGTVQSSAMPSSYQVELELGFGIILRVRSA